MLLLWTLSLLILIHGTVQQQQQQPNHTTTTPTYTIGLLFPDANAVRSLDPALNNMIITSEVAINMAEKHIKQQNYLPDVNLVFKRIYSDEFNGGITSWTTSQLIQNGTNAVIGDMVSNTTMLSAAMTSMFDIPQCSCGASSIELSDKAVYPYFFRTIANVVSFGSALMEWVKQMNWSMFALVYTDDEVGRQILSAMLTKSQEYGITPMGQIPLNELSPEDIQDALMTLSSTGARIVIVADSNPANQVKILEQAQVMGMLTSGWVWMLTNNLAEAISESVAPQDMHLYDGLMFISGLWNITDEPAYQDMYTQWSQMPVAQGYVGDQADWNINGLSYNAPNAYACAEVLALGLNKRLNDYPGGRKAALAALQANTFNSSVMTPLYYNMNYTGPAGAVDFTPSGDLQSGHFALQYMQNGNTVEFAEIHDGVYQAEPNVPIIYLGSTTEKPADMAESTLLNPTIYQPVGMVLYAVAGTGMILSVVTMVLIFFYRHLTMIMVASPLFLLIQLLGIALTYTAAILYMGKVTTFKCIFRQICIVLGSVLVTTSIIAKNYRIYRVFQNVFTLQASKLKSMYLLRFVLVVAVIVLAPLIIWYALYPVQQAKIMVSADSYCVLCTYPTSNPEFDWTHLNLAELISLLLCMVMVLISCLLAWKTRRVTGKWSESQQIGYVSYTHGLASIAVIPAVFLSVQQYQVSIYLKLATMLFTASVTLLVLFFPKLVIIVKYMVTEQRWRWTRTIYKRHGDQDLDDDRLDSCSQLTNVYRFDSSRDDNHHDALVARNLLDRSYQAHEGILPVKKRGRFHFMSIWELKLVIVIPSNQIFVLTPTTSSQQAQYYHYESCYALQSGQSGQFVFCVHTRDQRDFYFQVFDQKALERWVNWFQGHGSPSQDPSANNSGPRALPGDSSRASPKNKLPSTSTLGVVSSQATASLPSAVGNDPMYNYNTHHDNIAFHLSPTSTGLDHDTNHGPGGVYTTPSSHHRFAQRGMPHGLATEDTARSYSIYSTNTMAYYQPPHNQMYSRNDSNPIATFGINDDGDQHSHLSY